MAYIGESDNPLAVNAALVRTNAYTPAGSTSLIGLIQGTINSLPWASYAGGGTPGDGVNTWALIGQSFDTGGAANFTLAAPPTAGATSVALLSGFTGTTGNFTIVFNNGEYRTGVHLTNGNPNVPDSGTFTALTGTSANGASVPFNTVAMISGNPNVVGVYQAMGVSSAPIQFGASSGSSQLGAAAVIEYSSIALCSGFNFNHQGAPGTGANGVQCGNVSFAQSGVLFGFGFDLQSNSALIAGTSPLAFTSHGNIWSVPGTNSRFWMALFEDVAVVAGNSPAQGTFKGGNQFDGYNCFSAFFPSSAGSGLTPTPGAVTVAGNAPGLVRGQVIRPLVAKVITPERKIFLPAWARRAPATRPHV